MSTVRATRVSVDAIVASSSPVRVSRVSVQAIVAASSPVRVTDVTLGGLVESSPVRVTGAVVRAISELSPVRVTRITVSGILSSSLSEVTINCNNPPAGRVGEPYSHDLTAADGTGGYTFAVPSGLPPGLSVDSEGHISGTPTAAGVYRFTAQVTDEAEATDTVECSIPIAGPEPGRTGNIAY